MGDLTEGVQTIISIMKNSSTGLGTTGYEITDDDSNGLTISSGQLLVTASLSKDELKDQFGGTQDYDVIIVVRSEEIEDEWIGLSTKQWIENVIIEVNVIDKWSAVATKYITGDLVRYKAVNAIRKFIKAKTNAPGGTVNIWKLMRVINEEDKTTRPITYKAILTTEAWMYYNPNATYVNGGIVCATGEQVSNGGLEDGDFGGWVNDSWEVSDTSPIEDTYSATTGFTNRSLKQNFNILVECFTDDSTGQFKWTAPSNCVYIVRLKYKLNFSNGYTLTSSALSGGSGTTESFVQDILDAVTNSDISVTDKLLSIEFYISFKTSGSAEVDSLSIVAEG